MPLNESAARAMSAWSHENDVSRRIRDTLDEIDFDHKPTRHQVLEWCGHEMIVDTKTGTVYYPVDHGLMVVAGTREAGDD